QHAVADRLGHDQVAGGLALEFVQHGGVPNKKRPRISLAAIVRDWLDSSVRTAERFEGLISDCGGCAPLRPAR
ncbi:MAG: hypothetical protein M3N82_18640, partial [Pseudomonadota bacterium]|nr:hypothetical protein [Pseudomonadota bacterium]